MKKVRFSESYYEYTINKFARINIKKPNKHVSFSETVEIIYFEKYDNINYYIIDKIHFGNRIKKFNELFKNIINKNNK